MKSLILMVRPAGFEPATHSLEGCLLSAIKYPFKSILLRLCGFSSKDLSCLFSP